MNRRMSALLVVEVVLCFALPAYLLFWGLVTAPLWIGAIQRGGAYALWDLFDTVAGCIGAIGLVLTVRFCLSRKIQRPHPLKAALILGSACVGLLAIWGFPTTHFQSFSIDAALLFAIAPTLCTAHLLVLAHRRMRAAPPSLTPVPADSTL